MRNPDTGSGTALQVQGLTKPEFDAPATAERRRCAKVSPAGWRHGNGSGPGCSGNTSVGQSGSCQSVGTIPPMVVTAVPKCDAGHFRFACQRYFPSGNAVTPGTGQSTVAISVGMVSPKEGVDARCCQGLTASNLLGCPACTWPTAWRKLPRQPPFRYLGHAHPGAVVQSAHPEAWSRLADPGHGRGCTLDSMVPPLATAAAAKLWVPLSRHRPSGQQEPVSSTSRQRMGEV